MKKITVISFILASLGQSYSFDPTDLVGAMENKVKPQSVELISKISNQLTCRHMRRRFENVENLMGDLLAIWRDRSQYVLEGNSTYSTEPFDYINEKIDVNSHDEFSNKSVVIKVTFPASEFKNVDGIGGYIWGRFELTADEKFRALPIKLSQIDDQVSFEVKMAIGEVCLDRSFKLVTFQDCSKSIVTVGDCEKGSCLNFNEVDWSSCGEVFPIEIDLRVASENLGMTGRRLGRARGRR